MKLTVDELNNGQEFYQKVINKAWTDEKFKKLLIKDPVRGLEEISEGPISLNEKLKIVVEDQTDDTKLFLNIPKKISYDNVELTDEQLEIVSGGEVVVFASAFALGLMVSVCVAGATYAAVNGRY